MKGNPSQANKPKKEKYAQRVKLPKTMPGVGGLSAMQILVEIQDMSRFETADEFAAYLGLTPSQYSSGSTFEWGISPMPAMIE